MTYFGRFENEKYEELFGGDEFPVETANVSVSGTFERGAVLVGDNKIYTPVSLTSDSVKPFAISAEDYDSTDTGVCTVYTAGKFNSNKLKTAVDVNDLEEGLRRDNIILTAIV